METKQHNFKESLNWSKSVNNQLPWLDVYKKAFPDYANSHEIESNCQAQHMGIDRVISLKTGKTIYVDEKIRKKYYGDIALEYKHVFNNGSQKVGWIEKDLLIDYLAYAVLPIKKVALFDWQILKRAWLENRESWLNKYKIVKAQNNNYVSYSCAIPKNILFNCMTEYRIIEF